MKRVYAKRATWVLLGLWLILLLLAQVGQSDVLFGVSVAVLIVLAVVELAFNRCPKCGAYVGRSGGKYCPKCGEEL